MKIQISFIIIAYNEERSIGRCLDSILGLSGLKEYEILVVNDGSKDKTAEVVEKYNEDNPQINLINIYPNAGRGAARARGVNAAHGEYIAFVDADIILPKDWLVVCFDQLNQYHAVSGMPVPDGDVGYIYSTFNLRPKVANPTTIINGSNGLYRAEILRHINFDESARDGEDFAINQKLLKENYKLFTIKDLIVDHRETKSFLQSLRWLYQSGKGAARLFREFKRIRMPDLSFLGFMTILLISILWGFTLHTYSTTTLLIYYLTAVSILHLRTKFYLDNGKELAYVQAVLVNSVLLAGYFIGRFVGLFNLEKNTSR